MAIADRAERRRPASLWVRKPAYVYRPGQIVRRVLAIRHRGEVRVPVPWGGSLWVETTDMIGSAIARMGVHELPVTETIYRLVQLGDTTIDVGANLGYYTSLLACRAGAQGNAHAFEPHPALYERLCRNVEQLPGTHLHHRAVSDHDGNGFLTEPDDFSANMGQASVADRGIPITLTTLDAALPDEPVGLMKLDIEGHELAALNGARQTLGRTRHVIFEEHSHPPTPVTDALSSEGFRIYGIAETWRGPRLTSPERLDRDDLWEAPNYLATRDPRVERLVKPDGWRCLRPRR